MAEVRTIVHLGDVESLEPRAFACHQGPVLAWVRAGGWDGVALSGCPEAMRRLAATAVEAAGWAETLAPLRGQLSIAGLGGEAVRAA